MKQLLLPLIFASMALVASAGEIAIKFIGQRPDTMVYNAISYAERVAGVTSVDWRRVPLTADSVVIKVDDSELMQLTAWELDLEQYMLFALIGPGERIEAVVRDGNFRKASLSGTPFQAELNKYSEARREFEESEAYTSLERDDRIMASYNFSIDYVRAHRDEDVGVWTLQFMPVAMASTLVDSIGEDARTGFLQPLYEKIRSNVMQFRKTNDIKKRNREHGMAPDFTLKDLDGQSVSLSDYRGGWVILDFWATWCKWCIKGFPDLMKFADEFSGRCTVIGLSVDAHNETWKQNMETHPSNHVEVWVDATDLTDSNPHRSYAVEALPTKFLIAPDGTIALYEEGEDPEFLIRVRELINKK